LNFLLDGHIRVITAEVQNHVIQEEALLDFILNSASLGPSIAASRWGAQSSDEASIIFVL